MTEFTLSKAKRKALPETITVAGSAFSVNTDFRLVLKILRMLDDSDVPDGQKPLLICRWFYRGDFPRELLPQLIAAFQNFVRLGDEPRIEQQTQSLFDYEQDAQEIYASFYALYRIDLMETSLHWWAFSALLSGAFRVPCALSDKVRVRTLNPDDYKDPAAVRRMQDEVRIQTRFSRAEQRLQKRLVDILTGGGDVSAALEALKNEL